MPNLRPGLYFTFINRTNLLRRAASAAVLAAELGSIVLLQKRFGDRNAPLSTTPAINAQRFPRYAEHIGDDCGKLLLKDRYHEPIHPVVL